MKASTTWRLLTGSKDLTFLVNSLARQFKDLMTLLNSTPWVLVRFLNSILFTSTSVMDFAPRLIFQRLNELHCLSVQLLKELSTTLWLSAAQLVCFSGFPLSLLQLVAFENQWLDEFSQSHSALSCSIWLDQPLMLPDCLVASKVRCLDELQFQRHHVMPDGISLWLDASMPRWTLRAYL